MGNKKNKHVSLISGILVLGFVIVLLAIRLSGKYDSALVASKEPAGLDQLTTFLKKPLPLPEFTLLSHPDKKFTQKDLKGKWSFLFFGYTNCPDVCPNTMTVLSKVSEYLSKTDEMGDRAFIFATIDPKRDRANVVAEYVSYFNKGFIGLTGKKEDIDVLTKAMNISYILEESSNQEYQVGHSSATLLIDPKGRQVARFSSHQNAEEISGDFIKIRKHFQ